MNCLAVEGLEPNVGDQMIYMVTIYSTFLKKKQEKRGGLGKTGGRRWRRQEKQGGIEAK